MVTNGECSPSDRSGGVAQYVSFAKLGAGWHGRGLLEEVPVGTPGSLSRYLPTGIRPRSDGYRASNRAARSGRIESSGNRCPVRNWQGARKTVLSSGIRGRQKQNSSWPSTSDPLLSALDERITRKGIARSPLDSRQACSGGVEILWHISKIGKKLKLEKTTWK